MRYDPEEGYLVGLELQMDRISRSRYYITIAGCKLGVVMIE